MREVIKKTFVIVFPVQLAAIKISSWVAFFFVLLSYLFGSASFAQTSPDAGSLLRQQEELDRRAPDGFPEEEEAKPVKPAMKAKPGVEVLVKQVRFTGETDLVPREELENIVQDAIGQKMNFGELEALTDKVTKYLRDQGWLLARAYLPRQDVTNGVVEIAILKGRLEGSIDGGGGWRVSSLEEGRINKDALIEIAEEAAPSGSSVRKEEMERAMLLMNDLPGIEARSRLVPGAATGTTRVIVDANESPLFTGNAWVDNYGNYSTSEEQLSALVNLNNPAGRGSRGRLSATRSEGILLGRVGYSWPLNSAGLRGRINYTAMDYEVVNGAGVASDLEGSSRIAGAVVNYPFVRTREFSMRGSLGYQHKALKDDSNAGVLRDKRVDVYTLGLKGESLDRIGGGGLNDYGITLTFGELDLSRVPSDAENDASTLQTQGNYSRFNVDLSRLQRLTGQYTLLGRLSAQWTDDNLDSSEEFILGGPTGVRAYPVGEAQGDQGWQASLDLRYDWPEHTPLGSLRLSAFVDVGYIRLHNDASSVTISSATGKNTYRLAGAGLGMTLSEPGSHSIRFAWAHTIGDNDGRSTSGNYADGEADPNRVWLQAVVWF